MIIIVKKKQKMLKIKIIVKSACFQVILYIHSPMKDFFHTYQWQPQPRFQVQV